MTTIERMLHSIRRSIQLIASRALVALVDDSKGMQTIQARLLHGEVRDDIEHVQSYGFTSKPKPPDGDLGAEAVVVFLNGSRDHGVAVVVGDRRYRLKGLADGEVAIHDDLGQFVHLKRDGIEVEGQKITATASGDVELKTTSSGARVLLNASGARIESGGAAFMTLNGAAVEIAGTTVTITKV